MRVKKKLVKGVGVNDADYVVHPRVNGKNEQRCPFYDRWNKMLERCYSKKHLDGHPTYSGCSVTPEWHSFMNFKSWMEKQDWQDKSLDKDLLVEGNKIYGPDTCVFVTQDVNKFICDSGATRGVYPIGVTKVTHRFINKPYNAKCTVYGKTKNLGYFTTPEEAHQAWRVAKHDIAIELAAKQSDPRVTQALLARFP